MITDIRRETLKIVIIGHIDHGKSTLIGRLLLDTNSLPKEKFREIKKISKELGKEAELAFLADQLKEERERSVTIDTTQVFFKTHKRDYVIIDAPGHVEFIKNMLTGATQAEAAVLIVDAKEGIMEQTRRHAYLISMLGIDSVIVVFNKMDLVNYQEESFNKIKEKLSKFLKTLNLNCLCFIPISAKEGENICTRSHRLSWYKGPCVLKALDTLILDTGFKKRPLRFSVQDIYDIDGENLVVGRVESGMMKQNQKIVLLPEGREATINAIKVFGQDKQSAEEGESIAVILEKNTFAKRGSVISEKGQNPSVVNEVRGHVFWLSSQPLEVNKKIIFRCTTQEVWCVVEKIEKRFDSSTLDLIEENAEKLYTNEVGEMLFRTEEPIVVEEFSFIEELGRFALESDKGVEGAGIIVKK